MRGGAVVLQRMEQLLEQFLARAQAGVDDRDLAARLLAGEADHLLGQVADLHRLAHVEREDLAALANAGGLQDQLAGLGNGHEVARDFRVRHGDRAAVADLPAEQRHHRAGRIQHVAETHGHEAGIGLRVEVLAVDFGHALAGAHHAGGVDRLVGGDQHETRHPDRTGCIGHRAGTQRVVAERGAQLALQHRHVLVRRGMEHHLRLRLRKHLAHRHLIAAIGQDAIEDQFREMVAQLLGDPVQVVLAQLHHGQRLCA